MMRKVGLDESPVGIKIAGRNINNLRYADDTTLMAESEEELKSLLMRVKEESAKVGLKLNIKKPKIMASGPLSSWQIDGEEIEIFQTLPFPEPISASVSPPNAPPRQSRRQGQRNKRPIAVYNLCLELDDSDSLSPTKECTPTGSMDSLSSQSPTTAVPSSPPDMQKNHLITDSGDPADSAASL
ncbi:Rho GTPase-activating protein 10 [Varanus komodoensis]|nr:Rho GTPase-activating protein 10 [Varanus komodoensis]